MEYYKFNENPNCQYDKCCQIIGFERSLTSFLFAVDIISSRQKRPSGHQDLSQYSWYAVHRWLHVMLDYSGQSEQSPASAKINSTWSSPLDFRQPYCCPFLPFAASSSPASRWSQPGLWFFLPPLGCGQFGLTVTVLLDQMSWLLVHFSLLLAFSGFLLMSSFSLYR